MLIVLAGLIIGLTLGLLGAGGAILTVPVMVFVVGMPDKEAIASALFIVGTISALLSVKNVITGVISWRYVLWFGLPGVFGAYVGALAGSEVSAAIQMALFSALMLVAGMRMLLGISGTEGPAIETGMLRLVVVGSITGVLTGFVGVGGGFIIVPALVLLAGVTMSQAVVTSLVIITLNAYTGFFAYMNAFTKNDSVLNWEVIAW
ncbi:permease [Veronia nyctiphanis]|uniref:Probable membrane transporter protein n=1 Tax=Veronia nyctiphanis TaxID=1278244 RepID=A0A4Q0YLR9_9GAMM|nr:sulfite exporter TauE/SafE family protein [Veronia nyctiphanis]RXJ71720.1 permease [Veronia nyctiphanis]